MTRWAAFAGITLAVLTLLLLLARASQTMVRSPPGGQPSHPGRPDDGRDALDPTNDATDHVDTGPSPEVASPVAGDEPGSPPAGTDGASPVAEDEPGSPATDTPSFGGATASSEMTPPSTTALLANVAVSHGLFGALLVGGILYADVPGSALGITGTGLGTGPLGVVVGVAVGGVVAVANTLAGGLANAFGADPSRELRELLAPASLREWVLLLGVVLPVIAGFEELLFRAALVGGFAAGFGVSPWLLAVLSSVAFAAGHGAQGGLGVVVTGLLGLALAAAFVVTGSLLVVVVAHYVVNAAEFVVAEGLGWRPFE